MQGHMNTLTCNYDTPAINDGRKMSETILLPPSINLPAFVAVDALCGCVPFRVCNEYRRAATCNGRWITGPLLIGSCAFVIAIF